MSLVNLKINDVVDKLKSISNISSMFPGGIYTEPPLTNETMPYLYLTKYEFGERNNITKKAHVEFSIAGGNNTVPDEVEDMFITIDNELLPSGDDCMPVSQFGNVRATEIKQGSTGKPMRDQKGGFVMRKTYTFTYITQT